MLVLSRKVNQSIMIGDDVRIVVVGIDRDQVKLGIDAPRHVPVHRFEIYTEIQRTNPCSAATKSTVGKRPSSPITSGDADLNGRAAERRQKS
jgi:carbon storage regulator